MYDEKSIEDSLEFVRQIKLYKENDPEKILDSLRNNVDKHNSVYEDYQSEAAKVINNIDSLKEKKKSSIIGDLKDIPSWDSFAVTKEEKEEDVKKADAKAENTSEEIVEVDESDEDEDEEESSRFSFGDFMYIVGCVVVAIALAFVVTHYVGHHTRVDGSSMNNTLKNGDYLVIEKVSYYLHDPERYDIIVFPFTDEVNYIKRIIGLPGETVQIKDGKVFINGNELSDDVYGNELINDPGLAANPVSLGANEYFVLGDNRNSSIDSRKPVVGNIDGKKIDGKAVFRIYPFAAFGGVE